MFDFTPETVGLLVTATVACFLAWNYFEREKKRQNFLSDRLRSADEEEKLNKSEARAKLERQLDDINNPISYEKLMQQRNLLVLVGLAMFAFSDLGPIGIIIAIIGFKYPNIFLFIKNEQKKTMFLAQFPNAIDQLLNIMKVGLTPVQGYKILAEEMPYPCSKEFGKIYSDINTGAPLEKVLEEFYERYPISDIKLFKTGMLIANKATAKVAINTLQTIADTIKKRNSQKKQTKSLTMQGSMTAYIMGALPIVSFIGVYIAMPSYSEFLDTTMGKGFLVAALILDAIGFYVALKITSDKRIVNA